MSLNSTKSLINLATALDFDDSHTKRILKAMSIAMCGRDLYEADATSNAIDFGMGLEL